MKGKRILIVGGSGYLGRHLRPFFQADNQVVITGTRDVADEHYLRLDFNDKTTFGSLSGKFFDVVLVLASTITGIGSRSPAHADVKNNVMAYAEFLEYLLTERLTERLVYISSMTVYGIDNEIPVKETALCKPFHAYGLSKHLGEQLTEFVCRNSSVSGLVLRIPGIYGGDRNGGLIYNVITKCIAGEDVTLSFAGMGYWETIEINDLVQNIGRLLENYPWQEAYDVVNVSYGEPTNPVDTVHYIKEKIGSASIVSTDGGDSLPEFYLDNGKLRGYIADLPSFKKSLDNYIARFTK